MLPSWYSEYKQKIEDSIKKYLDNYFLENKNEVLDDFKESIYYSVAGGKRIRSILALEFYLLFSNKTLVDLDLESKDEIHDIIKFCIALELLHSYSLVHDDLPAMDNDSFRRGELTTWKKYGEASGVLIGDLLNSLAFEILGELKDQIIGLKLIKKFGTSVGLYGMIGGQVLDLYYEKNNKDLSLEKLVEVHNKKTGALIEFSVFGGILLSGFKGNIDKYLEFGKKIGLAFQVKDDLLDVEGTKEETGKSVGGEQKGFVHFIGLEKTKEYLNELSNSCLNIISNMKSKKLEFLVGYIRDRKK
ncbi:MAG: polyprenyl synthetase family protein [Candidatus Gracilibacteria bacterium]|nr:polyprenyl synthetase family protein [Candidatus Gracilibacteria bacterium]